MARKRSPERDRAFAMWKDSGGTIPLKDIAEALDAPEGTVRGWKAKDKWERTFPKKKRNAPKGTERKRAKAEPADVVEEDHGLTEKQRLFCLCYMKSFNITQAAKKAGYALRSAHVTGHHLLKDPKVAAYIRKLKGALTEDLFIDAQDVLRKYIEIAFADVSEFVSFGQCEAVVGVNKKTGKPIVIKTNYVDLKPSEEVDGALITEISQSKEGFKIKFANKMKALEKLELYFDLLPDKWKRQVEEERLKLDKEKTDIKRDEVDLRKEEMERRTF